MKIISKDELYLKYLTAYRLGGMDKIPDKLLNDIKFKQILWDKSVMYRWSGVDNPYGPLDEFFSKHKSYNK
jgi:hypothetical protein